MNNRIVYLDSSRAFCVIWIVGILHVIGYVMDSQQLPSALLKLFEAITMSSLATFTFLSGYFVAGKPLHNRQELMVFFKKRLIRFAVLYFFACSSLYIAGILLLNDVKWFGSFQQLCATLIGISGLIPDYQPATYWYFSMIILFYILTPFILFVKSESEKFLVSLALLVCLLAETTLVGADIRLPFYFIFYVAGAFCRNRMIYITNRIFLLVLLLLLLSSTINLDYYISIQNIVTAIIGTIIILSISSKIHNKKITSFLTYIAYGSMCAYLYHRHLYAFIKKLFSGGFWPIYIWPLAVIIIFISGYVIQKVYDKLVDKLGVR